MTQQRALELPTVVPGAELRAAREHEPQPVTPPELCDCAGTVHVACHMPPRAERWNGNAAELLQLVRQVGADLRSVKFEAAAGGLVRITCARAHGEPLLVIMPTLATATRQALGDL